MKKTTRTAAKLEMKQVFRKDPPIVFDTPVIRHCNASQRERYTGNRMGSPRARANDHYLVDSVGVAC